MNVLLPSKDTLLSYIKISPLHVPLYYTVKMFTTLNTARLSLIYTAPPSRTSSRIIVKLVVINGSHYY